MLSNRRQQGFSLIEILVAFMILAMSLTVIYRIFSGGLRNVALSEDYARAVLVAESQLAAIGISEPLVRGVSSGIWGERFRWQQVVESYQPWQQHKELSTQLLAYRITVNVDWEHAGSSRQVSLSSVRLKPVPQKDKKV
ncbi:MAG: prepilin-type N-terminal cleavage/methylation domain-containing protein [Halobacteria archaeon]|nr:prepilin-type N-terminal cleavage/methylation domain-containing protein [Halobacteria archaeon]